MTTPRGAQRVRYARFLFRILAPCEEGGNAQLSLRRTVSLQWTALARPSERDKKKC